MRRNTVLWATAARQAPKILSLEISVKEKRAYVYRSETEKSCFS